MESLKEEPDNEGEYLAMADHLKKIYDEVEMKNQRLTLDKMELQKILCRASNFNQSVPSVEV